MRKYTVEDVMAVNPCENDYPRKRIEQLFAGQDYLTLDDLPKLDIPDEHKLWVLIRFVLDDRQRRLFAADRDERALLREMDNGFQPNPRSWKAIDVARDFAEGKASREELMAAARDAQEAAEWAYERAKKRGSSRAARAAAATWGFAAPAGEDELKWQLERAMEYAREEGTTAHTSA